MTLTSDEHPFPTTRYQGSKRKLTTWIDDSTRDLTFDTVLDVFGGTGAVSHLFKRAGKQVTYNDVLAFNWTIGAALIENSHTRLSPSDLDLTLTARPDMAYPTFIQDTFADIYFTDDENAWLDRVVWHIDHLLTDPYQQALARFALFQACMVKRPYNLFHRANLSMRMRDVARSFGNKRAWDTPFETHFRRFAAQANRAVFDNGRDNVALNVDALDTPTGADLVYLDPPYLNRSGVGVDYRDFYHFLEGLTRYVTWGDAVDYTSRHRRLTRQPSAWTNASTILGAFEALIARHRDSQLVVSYRDDGIPTKAQLIDLLGGYKRLVRVAAVPQQYALSTSQAREVLVIGT